MSAAVFQVGTQALLAGGTVVLDGAEGHHAATVRRIGPGEQVVLTDGCGLSGTGVVTSAGRDRLAVELGPTHQAPRPEPRLTVVQALPKGDRGELAVETLTEVGADRIVPWAAARCVTRWRDDRGDKALERWRAVARAAAKQSRRTWWPHVDPLASTAQVADLLAGAGLGVVLHEYAGSPAGELAVPAAGEVVLVVGPEGGVDADELAAFAAAGALRVRLGPTVLRTSTAGTVAAAVVLARSSRWS